MSGASCSSGTHPAEATLPLLMSESTDSSSRGVRNPGGPLCPAGSCGGLVGSRQGRAQLQLGLHGKGSRCTVSLPLTAPSVGPSVMDSAQNCPSGIWPACIPSPPRGEGWAVVGGGLGGGGPGSRRVWSAWSSGRSTVLRFSRSSAGAASSVLVDKTLILPRPHRRGHCQNGLRG